MQVNCLDRQQQLSGNSKAILHLVTVSPTPHTTKKRKHLTENRNFLTNCFVTLVF